MAKQEIVDLLGLFNVAKPFSCEQTVCIIQGRGGGGEKVEKNAGTFPLSPPHTYLFHIMIQRETRGKDLN